MAQLHSSRTAVHRPYAAVYADSAERLAATGFFRALGGGTVPFDSTDLYKKALQLDDASEWILTAITPTWVQVSGAGSLANDSVTNALLANMAQATIKGRASGAGTGDPTDLTATQATAILNAVVGDSGSGGTKGLVPAPGAGDAAAGKFLKADGTFAVPATGGAGGAILTEDLSDDKITALPVAATMLNTDLFVIVDDPAGTPVTKRITKAEAFLPEVNQGENFGSTTKRWAVTYSAQFNAKAGDEFRWENSSRLIDLGDGFMLYRSNAGGTVKLSLGDSSSSATMIKRNGTVLEIRLGDDSAYGPLLAGSLRSNPVTVANLPGTPVEGMMVAVTDSNTNVWGATVAGGGANNVLAYYNGSAWTVAAK